MMTPRDAQTAEEAQQVLLEAIRNFDADTIAAIARNPNPAPNDTSIIGYAKEAQRRFNELAYGVTRGRDTFHHPV